MLAYSNSLIFPPVNRKENLQDRESTISINFKCVLIIIEYFTIQRAV